MRVANGSMRREPTSSAIVATHLLKLAALFVLLLPELVCRYDRLVTNIQWTFAGNLGQTSPNNSGGLAFTVRTR